MPAAQVKGARDTFCLFGPNRRSRNPESTARSSNDPPNRDQEYHQAYQSEDSEYDEPQSGYTARKGREFPEDSTLRTPEFRAEEDHHQFSYSFRQHCQWYEEKDQVRLLRKRGKPVFLGPPDMSGFVKNQVLMDVVSWSLVWEKRLEFDPFTRWQADFIRHMFGWLVDSR